MSDIPTHIGCAKFKYINNRMKVVSGSQQYCKGCWIKNDIAECQAIIEAKGLELLLPAKYRYKKHFEQKQELEAMPENNVAKRNEGAPVDWLSSENTNIEDGALA